MLDKTEKRVRRPIVRYYGGKWRLAPWIVAQMPEHRVYVEPFGGAASVLLWKSRAFAEIYNDLDGEIVNLFRVLRGQGRQLAEAVRLTPFSRYEFELSYIPTEDALEQARRTMVRCGMGFGSSVLSNASRTGFRGSATRSGTLPAGDWANQPATVRQVAERLRGVVIENRDALELMRYHDAPTTLHYCDPPYVHSVRKMADVKERYRHEMTDADHERLAETLARLQGMVMLSGYPSALYDRLYAGWERIERNAMADGARARVECLWFNAAAWARRPQVQIFDTVGGVA